VANLNNIKMQALFAMLKGEPGTRKSTCALSFPGRQFWVSTDRKMEAMVLPAKRFGIKLTDIDYEDYDNWDKPKAKLDSFRVNCPYKTLIVDSITSIGDNMTGQVKRIKKAEGGGKVIGNIPVSGLEEYNAESSAFQELIWLLKDIHAYHNCNIILIAHVVGQRKNDDANKLTHHSRVIITGGDKISGKLASYMTEVYHFNVQAGFAETDEGEYGCFTSHTGNDYARTALPLERYIKFNNQPLYEKWIEPAINRLNAEKPIERIATTNTTTATVPTTQPTTNSFVK
jgi:hypothetical protein